MIDRRDFFRITGLTAFAALFGGCRDISRTIVPFVIPPESYALGESLWYATACRQCPAGCGIVVRISEGRAKKIEGNPNHPVNRGKLCARGQAALQALYHPERLRQPMRRTGARGSGAFTPVSWKEALGILMGELKTVHAEAPESLLMLSGPMRGHRNVVAARFMKAFGSPHRVAWDPFGQDALLAASESVFGIRDLPEFDLSGARYALSFGGDFLETGLSPVHFGRAYGEMRQGRETVRGKLVHFGSRFSMTAANADACFPVAPGTESEAALAIAHVLVRDKLVPAAASAALWREGLDRHTPESAAKKTGLAPSIFVATAHEFAGNRPGLAIAGTGPATMTNGAFNLSCVALLNALSGSVGGPGGVAFPDRRAALARFGADAALMAPPPESGHAAMRGAIDRMKKGAFRAALLCEPANPAFALPSSLGFEAALERVPFVAAMAPFLDETTAHADLVLPTSHFLEEWGDDFAPMGHAGNAITLMQPVISVYHDTRSMPDILLAAARELGGPVAAALPATSFRELLGKAYAGMDVLFERALQAGGYFDAEPSPPRPTPRAAKPSLPRAAMSAFAGDPARFPFVLRVYPSNALLDGRLANLPWLQELPDPVTTAVWRNWVEINPATAAKLGIAEGDGVAVSSPSGTVHAHAVLHPGLAPDVVAMPLGQGHRRFGKFANGRGENPFALLPDATDTATGGPAFQSTRVALSKAAVKGRLVRFGFPEGQWKPDQFIA
ncbi:MAG TPA: molybdopterin-dependent oxidoreductase [Candidatus Deferrimicrobiaceae bacterium]|jgi:anaerobic selenocysteine-containing dehydrogenase